MRRVTMLCTMVAVTAAGAVELHVPLCRQLAPGHELAALLDGIKPAWLGLPQAVVLALPTDTGLVPPAVAARTTAPTAPVPSALQFGAPASSLPDNLKAAAGLGASPSTVPSALRYAAPGSALPDNLRVAAGLEASPSPAAVRLPTPGDTASPLAIRGEAVAPVAEPGGLVAVRPDLPTGAQPGATGRMAVLVARLAAGDDDPSLAATLNALPTADLLAEVRRCAWWNERDHAVADRLLTLLMDRGDLDPSQPAKLDADLTLMTAECLRRRVDARCVPLYDSLLAQQAAQPAAGWVHPVYGLATYYRSAGDYKQSAAVWLSAERYTTSSAVQDDYRLEAAWTLRQCGDEAGADKIEDQLLRSTSGAAWTIGLVTYSRAQRLLLAGKHTELRALLSRPAPVGGPTANPADAAAVQVALDGLLVDSYAGTGERALAAAQCRKVLRDYESLPDRHDGAGLSNVVATARKRLAEFDGQAGR